MTNKDNTILWILGIILVIVFIGKSGNLGLFSTQQVCTWNEPETREELAQFNNELRSVIGYQPFLLIPETEYIGTNGYFPFTNINEIEVGLNLMCTDFFDLQVKANLVEVDEIRNGRKIYYGGGYVFCIGNDKVGLSLGDNETRKNMVLDNYVLNFYKCESVYTPSNEMKELMNYFEDESSFKDGAKSIFYTGGKPYSEYIFMEFPTVDDFCSNWYLNPKADFLDGSNQQTWTIKERIKNNKKYFYVKNPSSPIMNGYYWCHNPNLMGYASSEVLMDKFFDKFYKISIEPQKCYAYLAETCQEVPCSTNYTKFNTLEKCVAIITEKNCSLLSLELRDDCCVKNFGENYKWEENSCKSQNGFEIKWWMILIGAGIVFIIIIILNKK